MIHDRATLDEFMQTEGRFIAAAWRDDPDKAHFILPDGRADYFRALAREKLRCMVPTCPAPEITTVARRAGVRQHFKHISGGKAGHEAAGEGFNHILGKTVIAAWLRSQGFDAQLEQGVETQRHRRARVADVMGIDTSTGQRFAFEIQYAPLTVTDWDARTKEYRAAGIPVTWLFGHMGEHFNAYRARGDEDDRPSVEIGGCAGASGLSKGTPPALWLNPTTQMVGFPVTEERGRTVPLRKGKGRLVLLPLAEFTLRGGVMWHEAFGALLDAEEWVVAEARRERHEQRQRELEAEAERRRRAAEREAERTRWAEASAARSRRDGGGSDRGRPDVGDGEPWVNEAGIWQGKPGWADITNPNAHARAGACDVCGDAIPEQFVTAGMVRHVMCALNSGKVYRARPEQPPLFDPFDPRL